MSLSYLDKTGLTALWAKIKAKFVSTSDLPLSISNGGTGKTSRLEALKALTIEGVGTDADYFLTITTGWGKGGYTSVADAKTVLGLGAAAYKSISSSFSENQTGLVQANTIYNNLWYKAGDTISITNMVFSGYITNAGKDIILYIPVAKPIATGVTAKVDFAKLEIRGISGYVSEISGHAFPNRELTINSSRSGFIFKYTHPSAYATTNNTPITARAFDDGSDKSIIRLKSS